MNGLTHREATMKDLETIVALLANDVLGKSRERVNPELDQRYFEAFERINADPNQYLMVVEKATSLVGTCHLTCMPSLTFGGTTRLQIEAVRVSESQRGEGIGHWMIKAAIEYGTSKGAEIIQLTTNKLRTEAKHFYTQLGFEATHEGMKLYL